MLKLGDKFVLTGKSDLNFSMVWKSCSRIPLIYVKAWMSRTLPKLTFSVPNLVEVDLVFLTRITIDLKGGGGGGGVHFLATSNYLLRGRRLFPKFGALLFILSSFCPVILSLRWKYSTQ